jgi:D-alanine-D-alanine ligase
MGKNKSKTHVVVLKGGTSAEREVSLSSGEGVLKALQALGYEATALDVTHDVGHFVKELTSLKPDVVFNALHGRWGEDGCMQGILEWMKIPYTHSGVMASALAMNKPVARKIFMASGLECAPGKVMTAQEALDQVHFSLPFVIKPLDEGSSVGVHVVLTQEDLKKIHLSQLPSRVLVEKYIPGREVHVAVLGNKDSKEGVKAIGAIEICAKNTFYDYEAKYTPGHADHLMPAPLPPQAYGEALEIAKTAHEALECRGASRVDLRYDDTPAALKGGRGKFYILELNTQPGMTPLSLVPEIAAYGGMSYEKLVEWLVDHAECM